MDSEMDETDRERWNRRYSEGAYAARSHPSVLVDEWLGRMTVAAEDPRAVDVACGLGRNALYLARAGWTVDALDVSDVALKRLDEQARVEGLNVHCRRVDLSAVGSTIDEALPPNQFDLALVIRYADLSLVSRLGDALKPGGYLIVEAHMVSDEDVIGPKGDRFRVEPGALRTAAARLRILSEEEGLVRDPDGRVAALSRLVARRPA
jgi:SAM-dependent methyltransferase